MSNNVNGVGGASQPTPEELNVADTQKEQQKQSYLVGSELQFMVGSLQNMAAQLQQRIEQAKELKREENTVGVGSAAPLASQTLPASALIDTSHFPSSVLGFTESFVTNPSATTAKANLLLLSTNLDNSVQQLSGLHSVLKNTLQSNVNPAALEASLQKLLPSVQGSMNQLEVAAKTLAQQPSHASLKALRDNLEQAAQNVLTKLSPSPSTTADLPAFAQKLEEQVTNQTSALQQLHLQHQKTANQVGGDLKMVLPQSHGEEGAAHAAAVAGGGLGAGAPLKANAQSNPWSEVWRWILGPSGIMAKVGSKMQELTQLLDHQSRAMKDFSGMLTLFADMAAWGIPSHFNPSQAHNDKTGFSRFQIAVKELRAHWPELKKDFSKIRDLMSDLESLGGGSHPKITGLGSLISGMQSDFFKMYNNLGAMRYLGMGTKHATPPPPWCISTVGNPSKKTTHIWLNCNETVTIWVKSGKKWVPEKKQINQIFTNGGHVLQPAQIVNFSVFQKYQRGVITKFNEYGNKFQQIAKDGGSNIQSLQTATQSKVKLYMLYYQQIMQTAPSIVQTLSQLIMAVSANFKGGQ